MSLCQTQKKVIYVKEILTVSSTSKLEVVKLNIVAYFYLFIKIVFNCSFPNILYLWGFGRTSGGSLPSIVILNTRGCGCSLPEAAPHHPFRPGGFQNKSDHPREHVTAHLPHAKQLTQASRRPTVTHAVLPNRALCSKTNPRAPQEVSEPARHTHSEAMWETALVLISHITVFLN